MELGACTLMLANMILAGTLFFNNPAVDAQYPGVPAEIAELATDEESRNDMQLLYEQSQLEIADHEAAIWGSSEQLADLTAFEDEFNSEFPFPTGISPVCGDGMVFGPGKFFLKDDVICAGGEGNPGIILAENTVLFMAGHDVINQANDQTNVGIQAADRVKIVGGLRAKVEGFEVGIAAEGQLNAIKHVKAHNNEIGIFLGAPSSLEGASSDLSHNLIAYVSAKDNTQIGIQIGSPNLVEQMAVTMDVKNNHITRSIASNNGFVGILVGTLMFEGELKNLSITDSLVYNNGTPEQNSIQQMTENNSAFNPGGIVVNRLEAINSENTSGQFDIQNILIANTVAIGNQGNGIEISDLVGQGIRNIKVFKNISLANGVDGFFIGDFTADKTKNINISHNLAAGNDNDGIGAGPIGTGAFAKLDNASTISNINVTHNLALFNEHIGINLFGLGRNSQPDVVSHIALSHNIAAKNGDAGLAARDFFATQEVLNVKVEENKANFNGCGITLSDFSTDNLKEALSSGVRHVKVQHNQTDFNFLREAADDEVSTGILIQRIGESDSLSKLNVRHNNAHFNHGVGLALDWDGEELTRTESLFIDNRVKKNEAWFNSLHGIFATAGGDRPSILIGKNEARLNGLFSGTEDILDEEPDCAPFTWTVNAITSGLFLGCPDPV